MANKKNRMVIFGSSGMLGRDIVDYFNDFKLLCPKHKEVDISNLDSVKSYFKKREIGKSDIVVNCAAVTDVNGIQLYIDKALESLKVNAVGAFNLSMACRDNGAWLIHISTDYVYSESSEDGRECPKNLYGHDKLLGEHYIRTALGRFTIIRVGCLYGMQNNKSFIHKFLKNVKSSNNRPYVVANQRSVPTSTSFVCDAVRYVIDNELTGTYNVSPHGGPVNRHQFANEILKLAKESGKFKRIKSTTIIPDIQYDEWLPTNSCMRDIDPDKYLDFYDTQWEWDLRRFFNENEDELANWYNNI